MGPVWILRILLFVVFCLLIGLIVNHYYFLYRHDRDYYDEDTPEHQNLKSSLMLHHYMAGAGLILSVLFTGGIAYYTTQVEEKISTA